MCKLGDGEFPLAVLLYKLTIYTNMLLASSLGSILYFLGKPCMVLLILFSAS